MDDQKEKHNARKQTLDEPVTARVGEDGPIRPEAPSIRDAKDEMRHRFMGSPYVEWAPFAHSVGLDPAQTRNMYPIPLWIAEKKRKVAIVQAESIAQALFDHRSQWHKDVLKTLTEYPAANDAMLGILKRRMNDIIEDINADTEARKLALANGKINLDRRKFDKWTTRELQQLAQATKAVTESKHRSLCLSDWKAKLAQEATNPEMLGAPPEGQAAKDTGWIIELTGGDKLTTSMVQDLFDQYIDPPDGQPHIKPKSDVVEAAASNGLARNITPIMGEDNEDDSGEEYDA